MSKILLFSDIHIHGYRPFSYEKDGMNSRLAWTLRALTYILSYAIENQLDVWFLGDLFEDRKTLRMDAAIKVGQHLNMFAADGGKFYAVPGNHDYYSKTDTVWGLYHGWAQDVTKFPSMMDTNGKRVAIYPYPIDGYDKFKEFLSKTEADYLFTHCDMDVEKAGLDEHEIKVGATSIELYKRFGKVFSGHYHWRQTVNNFTYLGNPLQKDFGDCGQDKGFHVLDLSTGEAEFITLPGTFPRFERFSVIGPEDWNSVIEHRTRRGQDYLKISYDPTLGVHKELDVTTNPVPILDKIRNPIVLAQARAVDASMLNSDPVKAFVDYKVRNGGLVPKGGVTFAKEILEEAKK